MPLKIKGATSGSVTLKAPDTGSDTEKDVGTLLDSSSSINAANLTGTLPAISGAALTNLPDSGSPSIDDNGSATAITIDSSGRVTMSSQPAFSAFGTGGNTAFASGAVFSLPGESFDIGNNYSSNRFTAPVSGIYLFHYGIYSYSQREFCLKKNGSDFVPTGSNTVGLVMAQYSNASSLLMNLSTNDYIEFGFRSGDTGNVYLSHGHFQGRLVG